MADNRIWKTDKHEKMTDVNNPTRMRAPSGRHFIVYSAEEQKILASLGWWTDPATNPDP